MKLISKDPIPLGMIDKGNGIWKKLWNCSYTYSGCVAADQTGENTVELTTEACTPNIITEDRINWAKGSFDPYKSPGPGGIYPILIKKVFTAGLHSSELKKGKGNLCSQSR